jgi:uncharacterized protein involved in exopolysaccharide biosynthesis
MSDKPEPILVRLERLRQELATLRVRYNENYPDILWLQTEIAALEQHLAAAESTKKTEGPKQKNQTIQGPSLNPYVQQQKKELAALEVEIRGLHTAEQNLLHSIALYQQRIENTPWREQELRVVERNYGTAKELYQSLLQRQGEAKMAEDLEQRQKGEQFRLLESAVPVAKPAEPNRPKLALTGLFLGLGLAVGVVILAEYLDSSFHTVDDLRGFSPVPVLVSLPCIITRDGVRRRRWRFGLATLSAVLGLVLIVGASHLVINGQVLLSDVYTQLQRLRE